MPDPSIPGGALPGNVGVDGVVPLAGRTGLRVRRGSGRTRRRRRGRGGYRCSGGERRAPEEQQDDERRRPDEPPQPTATETLPTAGLCGPAVELGVPVCAAVPAASRDGDIHDL
ncbi:hypothetical protein [Frankia sp. Cas4]|uniref:hypothetical protein n=1 Tax=Frankia sp. Cas4 TaxID=3073927 RepID=UPI002AD3EEE2|nr:hypothetical protein [Frankia sp. Cas4]